MTALVPASMPEAQSIAKELAQSSLVPEPLRNKPHDVLAVMLAGMELGLSPMQAFRGIYIVKGRPILAADTIVGLCKARKDVCKYFRTVESTATKATCETWREGDPEPTRLTWTAEMAKRAGLGGQTWSAYPEAMLRHRCAAALARDVYPDLMLGIYEEGEAAEIAAPKVEVVTPAPERRPAPTAPTVEAPAAEAPKALPEPKPIPEEIAARASLMVAALEQCPDAEGYHDLRDQLATLRTTWPREVFERVAKVSQATKARLGVQP